MGLGGWSGSDGNAAGGGVFGWAGVFAGAGAPVFPLGAGGLAAGGVGVWAFTTGEIES